MNSHRPDTSEMAKPLDIATDGGVQTWTMNLPEVGNAITGPEVIEAFEDAIDAVNADTTIGAVILTGAGHIFSSGGNVKDMAEKKGLFADEGAPQRQGYSDGIQRIPRAMRRLEVPIIAAVNGAAVGAGCDLTLMCDIRIAAESAFFAESFVQLGLIPGDGGAWFLQRIVGYQRAAQMTFTGDRVHAPTALEWGLVSQVVADDALLDEARSLADRIARNPGHSLRMAKRLLAESQTSTLDQALHLAAAMQPLAHLTDEHRERVARWAKR